MLFLEVNIFSLCKKLIFILYFLANHDQFYKLIVNVNSLSGFYKWNSKIILKFDTFSNENLINSKIFHESIGSCGNVLKTNIKSGSTYFLEQSFADDGSIAQENYVNVEASFDENMNLLCSTETDGHNSSVPLKTFMKFKILIKNQLDPFKKPDLLPKIKRSFKHELTIIGHESLMRVKDSILDRHRIWISGANQYIAPLTSLSQSSGSGKTKISIELLKQNPGFYLVFRRADQSGFPLCNSISSELYNIISGYEDTFENQEEMAYLSSCIGRILDFLARIITKYFIEIIENSFSTLENQQDLSDHFENSLLILAKRFENNEELGISRFPSKSEMESIYRRVLSKSNGALKVKDVSDYIYVILEHPERCFDNDSSNTSAVSFSRKLKSVLNSFPFVFVVDEADILKSDIKLRQKSAISTVSSIISGFEVFRRALSYLPVKSKIMFLTLGTKSDIFDLNPPVVDMSLRLVNRNTLPFPIILSSNTNIFYREYPIYKLKPTFALLSNPIYFKFLLTLGHGIWCSYPFNDCIDLAMIKLKNGSGLTLKYVIALWMIRAGFVANKLNSETGSLVANNMASLLGISDDLKELTVAYPSEPILALAARSLTNSLPIDALFQVLKDKIETLHLDHGRFAEIFSGMIILRAIDLSKNIAFKSDESSYPFLSAEINEIAPEFSGLWNKKSFILEGETDNSSPFDYNFPFYSIYNVDGMLKSLLGIKSNINFESYSVPSETLNGLVNATHIVNLTRDPDGFKYKGLHLKPFCLPLADERIVDKSRNVIDQALLKIGLLRQCAFSLPTNYYGYDYLIPVLLESGELTFIGVQVKRANANLSDNIHKMQARLHFVKCPDCKSDSLNRCEYCASDSNIRSIYYNSITLLISLDDEVENVPEFRNGTAFYSNCDEDDKSILKAALNRIHVVVVDEDEDEKLKFSPPPPSPFHFSSSLVLKNPSKSFMEPLIHEKVSLGPDVLLSKTLWDDSKVFLKKAIDVTEENKEKEIENGKEKEKEKKKKKKKDQIENDPNEFRRDGFIHRQFCFATRGWGPFKHLFGSQNSVPEIAASIMSLEGIFRKRSGNEDSELVRKVIYDTSPNYIEYTDELAIPRGRRPRNDLLNDEIDLYKQSLVSKITDRSAEASVKKPKFQ